MNTKLSLKQIMIAAAMAAGVSVVINAIVFLVGHATGIITDDVMIQPMQPLQIMPVIMASLLPTFVGAFVFFLFEKYSSNGFRNFSILAVVLLLLSFYSPFAMIPGASVSYSMALEVMHIVVAGSLLFFINKAKNR